MNVTTNRSELCYGVCAIITMSCKALAENILQSVPQKIKNAKIKKENGN